MKWISPLRDRIEVGGIAFDALSEAEVAELVVASWISGTGGSIVPVNVDVARVASRSPELGQLIERASVVVADGMPIVWASHLQGGRLPERVAGSSLVLSLSSIAAANRRSVYVFGGAEGVPQKAAERLAEAWPSIRVAGAYSPPFGFDSTEAGFREAISAVVKAAPDLVFVGLGFPRQELFIERLRSELPGAWCLACGGAISMAAGSVRRASPLIQRLGLEWMHRLVLEPRRLAKRYLVHDLPFAIRLITLAAIRGVKARLR